MDVAREEMAVAEVIEIGPNGDDKSAVATLNGSSRMKKMMGLTSSWTASTGKTTPTLRTRGRRQRRILSH